VELSTSVRSLRAEYELAEAFDFLDAVWQLAFSKKRHLVGRVTHTEVARLATPCNSREDFEANLSAVNDIFKRMVIPDDLLPEDHGLKPDETFKRLGAAVAPRLDEPSNARVERAIGSLYSVNNARVALQHGKPAELACALAGLRLQLTSDWSTL
jgi:hypothetical protein